MNGIEGWRSAFRAGTTTMECRINDYGWYGEDAARSQPLWVSLSMRGKDIRVNNACQREIKSAISKALHNQINHFQKTA